MLDLGAGGGDIIAFVVKKAREQNVTLVPVTLDRHRSAASLCRDRGIPTLVADAWALPLAPRSVDVVIVSQLLHHFRRDAGVRLLRDLAPLVRRGIVVADLRRAHAAAVGIWLAGLALGFHSVTRRDGFTSVRRGFTRRELSDLLRSAGLQAPVYQRPGYRLVAVWTPSPLSPFPVGEGDDHPRLGIRDAS